MTVSPSAAKVEYGTSSTANEFSATGTTNSYDYLTYSSGQIHQVVIGPLNFNTVYYYRLGDSPSSRPYTLKTPPPQFPIKFAIVGKQIP